MSNKSFEAERVSHSARLIPLNNRNLTQSGPSEDNLLSNLVPQPQKLTALPLRIPRKPHWTKDMTKIELEDLENMAFLQWRRGIATMEENFIRLSITPYEKNLQVWRQLWRSLERSDLAVQIIDARNPIFFYCPDIKIYLNEMLDGGQLKGMLVVLNKADLLSEEMRKQWNQYFCKEGIDHVFFSAKKELDQIQGRKEMVDQNGEEEEQEDEDNDYEVEGGVQGGMLGNKFGNLDVQSDQEQDDIIEDRKDSLEDYKDSLEDKKIHKQESNQDNNDNNQINQQDDKCTPKRQSESIQPQKANQNDQNYLNTSKLLNRDQLHLLLRKLSLKYWMKKQQFLQKSLTEIKQQEQSEQTQSKHQSSISNKLKLEPVVGMIGYPNVGKSSLINALLGKKQVAVAAMPGKTRYLQTIFINPPQNTGLLENYNRMCLCDCPGLVFPSFTNSRAELVCAGVIPIDHLREFFTSIDLVTQRVNKEQLQECYKISLPQKFSGLTFLKKVAAQRGFVTGSSLPDTGKVARLVLKDFVSGKLCFCHSVPSNQTAQSNIKSNQRAEDDEIKQEQYQSDMNKEKQIQIEQKNAQQTATKTLKKQKQSQLDSDFFVGEQRQMKKKNKLTKQQKRAIKFAILRGDQDIEGTVSKALSKNSKKIAKGHKMKIGKEYYGANEVFQRGKGGMDLTDF